MHLVDLKELSQNMIVAENVYSKNGQLIIPKNTALTQQMINHLTYYRIISVPILDGDIPNETQKAIQHKSEIEQTHLQKLLETPEYIKFRECYTSSVQALEGTFNEIIFKNTPIDEHNIIIDTVELFQQNSTTYNIFGMLHAMKKIDDSTTAHCMNVSIICRLIGTWVGLDPVELDQLTLAGLLHDIGKCKIPIDIIQKPGKLTQQEYEFIKYHPSFGYDIVKDMDLDLKVKRAILLHHERYDGTGYPYGVSGDKLGDFESIIAIVDVYDAMTSNRCYRSALCPFDVISNFEQEGINKYHPKYILTFLEKIANSYINSEVLLSNDKIARIIYITNKLTRPVVHLADTSEFLSLEEHPEIYIQAII